MFLTQLNVFQLTTLLYVDNQSCMKIMKNRIYDICTKFIKAHYHYGR
jgi:hypothetical protein